MTALLPFHAAALAAVHAEAFPPGERWNEASFAALLGTPGVYGWLDPRGAFVLARQAGGETEVLTLAVAPGLRRQGVARGLLGAAMAQAVQPVFLEVAADNPAALALYAQSGFAPCGRRRGYYGQGRDALVLRHG